MFNNVECKLGNMRKSVSWVVYPKTDPTTVIIQSNKRIAKVDLLSGKAKLSSGKHGNGFSALMFGTIDAVVPTDVLNQLKDIPVNPTGQVVITR